jgi:cytochrome c peroxidase
MYVLLGNISIVQIAQAHGSLIDTILSRYAIPTTPGLLDGNSPIITDKTAAIQLGKALFWDVNVGSNGIACASCHFHAGADSRTANQLNTGTKRTGKTAASFELFDNQEGVNHTLTSEDFPFFRLSDVDNKNSKIIFQTDDVVGSAGLYKQRFTSIDLTNLDNDTCVPMGDDTHHVGNFQTRQTTNRNAPTVIDAIFNHRNFWDGRANNEFNGVSVFGPRDKNAKIWIANKNKLTSKKIALVNASLASQAVGPPTDMIEMSCSGRTFNDIAQKLLPSKPLANQEIHPEDSVLANLRNASGIGLNSNYEALVKKAFNPIYWSSTEKVPATSDKSGKAYSQMEANFSFFFGLAIQVYESTLISDQSKLDLALANMPEEETIPASLSEAEKKGAQIFEDLHCNICHAGPTFSTAVNLEIYSPNAYKVGNAYVDRIGFVPSSSDDSVDVTLTDKGFFNTSVVPDNYDAGLGDVDPWGNPLSYAMQYVNSLKPKPQKFVDRFIASPCDFTTPFTLDFKKNELKTISKKSAGCSRVAKEYATVPKSQAVLQEQAIDDQGRLSTLTTGAFKVPTLRNVELTGPYMHNGGMKSLKEVVEFYNRGGNVYNRRHAATLVFAQGFSQEDKDALEAFLKTFTDERVRWEKAPFDHPAIKIPNGHNQTANGSLLDDEYLSIPAVGKNGLPSNPLKAFEDYL